MSPVRSVNHVFGTDPVFIGRGERIRTFDPHNPIVVRYQAALRPDFVRRWIL